MSRAAITGASGYVGSAIARAFRRHGWEVVELGRRSAVRFELGDDPAIDWTGIDALVHCAWDFRAKSWEEVRRINIAGSVRLMESARGAGVNRGVFISSLSCFEGCRSLYGKGKLAVEKEVARLGYAGVRPGLVYGDRPGGIVASLEKVAARFPLVPLIGDGSFPQYPVHDEDLAELVFALAQSANPPTDPISAASGEPIPFRDLLRRMAARHNRHPAFLPVPWRLIHAGLRTVELAGLNPPFRSDSLVGFVFQNPRPDFTAAHALQSFRPFE